MPNRRAKNKVHLGGYLERELYEKILRHARDAGMGNNKFGFVRQVVENAIQRRERRMAGR
jgi:hypothetical protein